ncbi:hypothetical protein [Ureibacillus chungkukjangi]|uniref:Uncharacterized protein n=1 Tax=Ureibacillus chungkukjangi TaxID=1202712 RepID=A0A318TMR7_9BACL|nr:hypothetical protein [Ureibacillus chungkukjangi]MCM3386866.1 hypothetical protein [Ureibacillus chungkukjangi]PYF06046.1 hypothetical protein BJ095_1127 [Ureibacillus chungkukjangi]
MSRMVNVDNVTLNKDGRLVRIPGMATGWYNPISSNITVFPDSLLEPNMHPKTQKTGTAERAIKELIKTGHIKSIGSGLFKVIKPFQGSVSGTKVLIHSKGSNSGLDHWIDDETNLPLRTIVAS